MDSVIKDEKGLHRSITAAEKAGLTRVSDGGGLYLLLKVKGGGRAWRFDYAFEGKRKTLSLGVYPDVGLATARQRRNDARALLAQNSDPSAERKAARKVVQKAAVAEQRVARGLAVPGTFRDVFEQWLKTKSPGLSDTYVVKIKARFNNDVLPWLGDKQIIDIDEKMLLECLRRVQARGAIESAHSSLQNCGQVFRFGIASGLANRNPAQGMSEALQPVIVTHQAAIDDPDRFAELLKAINTYRGSILTRIALLVTAATFQRVANIRGMRWADLALDAESPVWSIPSEDMKRTKQQKASGRPHLVPLAEPVVAWLKEIQPLTGSSQLVFTASTSNVRVMSENTLNQALKRLDFGGEIVSHGFRSSARTLLVERLGADPEIVEAQLAHVKSGPLGSAYDRAQYMEQRVKMMAMWGRVVADCAAGKPFPRSAPVAPATAPEEKADPKLLASMIQKLTGQRVTAAMVKRELAKR